MIKTVTLIPGDGIGPEITDAVLAVLEKSGAPLQWDVQTAGADVLAQEGTPLPQRVIDSIKKTGLALKAPVTTPIGEGFRSINVALRKELDLFANLRPSKNIRGIKTRFEGVDLVIVRENTEDLYAGIEHMKGPDRAESLKIITRGASLRIARFAFEYAVKQGRRTVWAVNKANICKLSDGLFLNCAREIAEEFPQIQYKEILVDNCCLQLVQNPELFDVLLCPNLYGDILSDLAAGLVGGLGVAQGANIGTKAAVFEPVHGSAPDIKGQGKANPTALLLSAIEMLHHLGLPAHAEAVDTALRSVLGEGKCLTPDLGGRASTKEFTEQILIRI